MSSSDIIGDIQVAPREFCPWTEFPARIPFVSVGTLPESLAINHSDQERFIDQGICSADFLESAHRVEWLGSLTIYAPTIPIDLLCANSPPVTFDFLHVCFGGPRVFFVLGIGNAGGHQKGSVPNGGTGAAFAAAERLLGRGKLPLA